MSENVSKEMQELFSFLSIELLASSLFMSVFLGSLRRLIMRDFCYDRESVIGSIVFVSDLSIDALVILLGGLYASFLFLLIVW
jgi:hypothetical protein